MQALSADAWRRLFELLDTALDLPEDHRESWLMRLDAAGEPLTPKLRELLASRAQIETLDFIGANAALRLAHGAPPPAARVGERLEGARIGAYRLLREVGAGGMGTVWLAERADGLLKRPIALKLPHATWGGAMAERLVRERDILAALEHPLIARLYDAGNDDLGRPYLAMEYVPGQAIDMYCRERDLPMPQRVAVLLQVLGAVAYAHSKLVVHRDLKPSNILVTGDGQVRLLDFGIAKLIEGDSAAESLLTQHAGRALTRDYASPEQLTGQPLSTASDLYSLGIVAFELLAGRRPYQLPAVHGAALAAAIENARVPQASSVAPNAVVAKSLRGDLDAILNKALKKSPAERYRTADAFALDLQRWLQHEPVSARPDSIGYRLLRLVQRRRLESAIVASVGLALVGGAYPQVAVLLALAAGTAIALWQVRRSREQRLRAEGVKRFLVGLFDSGSAMRSDGTAARGKTVEALLRDSAQQVLREFDATPRLKLDLVTTLGKITRDLDMADVAGPLLEARLQLGQQLREPIAERVAAGIDRYWMLQRGRRYADAEAQLRASLAEAQAAHGAGAKLEAARVLAVLARQLAETSQFMRGELENKQALRVLAKREPQSIDCLDARVLQAQYRVHRGDEDQGLADLHAAVEQIERHPEIGLVNKQYFQNLLAAQLIRCEQFGAAVPLLRELVATMGASGGAGNNSTLTVQRNLGIALLHDGRPREAIAEFDAIRAMTQDAGSSALAMNHWAACHWSGSALIQLGDFVRGATLQSQAAAALADLRQDNSLLQTALRQVAQTHLLFGRFADAQASLDSALASFERMGTQDTENGWRARVERAVALAWQGQIQSASEIAEQAVRAASTALICDQAGAGPNARLLLARLALWSGRAQQGQSALHQLLSELQPMRGKRSVRLLIHEVQLELAAALLRSDDARAALLAQQTLSALVGDALEQSPLAVRTLAIAAAAGTAGAPTHGRDLGLQMLDPSFMPRIEQP